ncbi:MAG TPA: DinB family protein [Gemmatimonadaceae bacterium]|nr:DinB family protein [Gemmatimonadaceae bacterium]
MKILRATILALALPVGLAAQEPSAAAQANPITSAFRARILNFHRILAQAFDSIPEAKFSFKPTPAQQSVGFIAQHLANDNYLFCNQFGAMKQARTEKDSTTADSVKATWPKDSLVAKLKESFAFCQRAVGQLEDAKLGEQVTLTFGGNSRQVVRAGMVLGHALDMADHYSQIANYMRLNNMLPPTALPRRPSGD